jgi:hypothetical protein
VRVRVWADADLNQIHHQGAWPLGTGRSVDLEEYIVGQQAVQALVAWAARDHRPHKHRALPVDGEAIPVRALGHLLHAKRKINLA